MLQLVGYIKWLFPEPLRDVKAFLTTIVSCSIVYFLCNAYASQKDKELKKEFEVKQVVAQNSVKNKIQTSHNAIMAALSNMQTNQKMLNSDLKRAIIKNGDKLWELSRKN